MRKNITIAILSKTGYNYKPLHKNLYTEEGLWKKADNKCKVYVDGKTDRDLATEEGGTAYKNWEKKSDD